jgi:hypothetical protein
MSRHNKVNPDHYTIAGRLTPDDLARERWKQQPTTVGRHSRRDKPQPPWMHEQRAAEAATPQERDERQDEGPDAGEAAPPVRARRRSTPPKAPARRRTAKAARPPARKGTKTSPRVRQAKPSTGSAKAAARRAKPATRKRAKR